MPTTRISTNYKIPDKTSLVNDVHNTLVNVLKIPVYDRLIIVDENQKGFFQPLNTAGKVRARGTVDVPRQNKGNETGALQVAC